MKHSLSRWLAPAALLAFTLTVLPFEVLAQPEAPTAESPAPAGPGVEQLDPELAPAIAALGKIFAENGQVKWTIAAPLIGWLLVFAVRKLAKLIPWKIGEWLRSRPGGIVLALLMALAQGVLDLALSGGALTVASIAMLIFTTIYGWFGSMGIQSGSKNAVDHIKAKREAAAASVQTGADAHSTIASAAGVRTGPNP